MKRFITCFFAFFFCVLMKGQNAYFDTTKTLTTIAFGSCNREDLPQQYWDSVALNQPDLWIWLGDNIYGDTENMKILKKKYRKVKKNKHYQQFCKKTAIIGTWDDHDYGANDGDKNYPKKRESKELLLEFLDVPPTAAVRKREGVYQSFMFGKGNEKIKIILLDTRFFRDTLQPNPTEKPRYFANETGDILGEEQWRWFENELAASDAAVHLIVSGVQILHEEQFYEKWANFPRARQRLLELLQRLQPARTVLLSGDRHIGEVAKIELEGWESPLYEVTSSGLTHSAAHAKEENSYRVGAFVTKKHFAVLKIDWSQPTPQLVLEHRTTQNDLIQALKLN